MNVKGPVQLELAAAGFKRYECNAGYTSAKIMLDLMI